MTPVEPSEDTPNADTSEAVSCANVVPFVLGVVLVGIAAGLLLPRRSHHCISKRHKARELLDMTCAQLLERFPASRKAWASRSHGGKRTNWW